MKAVKVVSVALAAAGLIALAVYMYRTTTIDVKWEANWPRSVRGVGEASELIVSTSGKQTEADVARAKETARWKAYYFAQLRLAEQLQRFQLDANTTIRDMALVDQELHAKFNAITRAAAEVEAESSVTTKGNVAVARVVVEAPEAQLVSFKDALLTALRSGRVHLARTAAAPQDSAGRKTSAEPGGSRAAAVDAESNAGPDVVRPAGSGTARSLPATPLTGSVLLLGEDAAKLNAAPTIYDAAGLELGSALDLPADRQLAGLPIASSSVAPELPALVGSTPLRLKATISGGDIFTERALSAGEATAFREHLKRGKIALVLEKS